MHITAGDETVKSFHFTNVGETTVDGWPYTLPFSLVSSFVAETHALSLHAKHKLC